MTNQNRRCLINVSIKVLFIYLCFTRTALRHFLTHFAYIGDSSGSQPFFVTTLFFIILNLKIFHDPMNNFTYLL